MNYAKRETIQALFNESMAMPVVDSHTHIQDDIAGFDAEAAKENLVGTQAAFNKYPQSVLDASIKNKYLVRRLMTDPLHGLIYSWFAQIAEGARGNIEGIIKSIGNNTAELRMGAARQICEALKDSRFSEYAQWLRTMFAFYLDDTQLEGDIISPKNIEILTQAVASKRNSSEFAANILKQHNIKSYVTSIENRCNIPALPQDAKPELIDLSYTLHTEAYNMFDAHYLVWPEGATDFGLFLGGHKYEAEKYLINLEKMFGVEINSANALADAVGDFLRKILWSPKTNPTSRIRYVNIFMPVGLKLNEKFDIAEVETSIKFRKNFLHGDSLRQVSAFVTQAMLRTLDEIGKEILDNGEEYGSCLQIAMGVSYFMDSDREIQSFPIYKQQMPQEAYSMWTAYKHIHFEYILANEQLYADFSNVAKQVANISVGPWWHFFRKHHIAEMLYDQLTMGPISSVASGFTDARFVEMLVAKYQSVRWGVSTALAEMVDDPFFDMSFDSAVGAMNEILYKNPIKVHHLPEM